MPAKKRSEVTESNDTEAKSTSKKGKIEKTEKKKSGKRGPDFLSKFKQHFLSQLFGQIFRC